MLFKTNFTALVFLCVAFANNAFSQCGKVGFALPYYQNFENITNLSSAGFTIINPDNGNTWAVNNNVTGAQTGNSSLWINFYNYNVGVGERDTLKFPLLNFSGVNNPILKFNHAYTRYTGYDTDSLLLLQKTNVIHSGKGLQYLAKTGVEVLQHPAPTLTLIYNLLLLFFLIGADKQVLLLASILL